MKIIGFDAITAIVALSPTDCLILADALAESKRSDQSPDTDLTDALRAALEACAIVAASDTLRDAEVDETGMLDHTRHTWGPRDVRGAGIPRLVKRPR